MNASLSNRSKTPGMSGRLSQHQKNLADRRSYATSQSLTESMGISGYRIQKHVFYDNPNKNIANWKSRKLLERGKHTMFDEVIKEGK
jgi:hypothetical protein